MKVLWIVNVLFPEICKYLSVDEPVVGGWMYSSALNLLRVNSDIQLSVASLYEGEEFQRVTLNNISYFLIPCKFGVQIYDTKIENYFFQIKEELNPDIVHIHGTEYPHSLAYINACGKEHVVVSVQGLVSIYSEHYYGGIESRQIGISIRDILKLDWIGLQQRKMLKRGEYEKSLIKNVDFVIGRTTWDYSNVWGLNPNVKYFTCNETLRPNFYSREWKLDECDRNTIFISQAHYPIKGLHQLIEALPIVMMHYPKTIVYVAGVNFIDKPWFKRSGYSKYIRRLLKRYCLFDKVIFLGKLEESQMSERLSKSHIYICPSVIENSPNSLAEAQLMGVPCISSYVGGTMDMIRNGITGYLYRYEETSILARLICNYFENDELCVEISRNEKVEANKRHDCLVISNRTMEIYNTIINEHNN